MAALTAIKRAMRSTLPPSMYVLLRRGWIPLRRLGSAELRTWPGIPGQIHPRDGMLGEWTPANLKHYQLVGENGWQCISECLQAAHVTPRTALDLPCGYGRVLRYIVQHVPEVTASDVIGEAVRFCAQEFHVRPVMSTNNLAFLRLPDHYDLIWVGSLVTHLAPANVGLLLDALSEALTPGGLLVFTTMPEPHRDHLSEYGPPVIHTLPAIRDALDREGQYFEPRTELAFHSAAWVKRMMQDRPLQPVGHLPRGWDDHQDVWAFQKLTP